MPNDAIRRRASILESGGRRPGVRLQPLSRHAQALSSQVLMGTAKYLGIVERRLRSILVKADNALSVEAAKFVSGHV
jgi:hypothetical protein